jgi:hypothetical protein
MQWRREVAYICVSSILVLHSMMRWCERVAHGITMQNVLAFYCIIFMGLHLRCPTEVGLRKLSLPI